MAALKDSVQYVKRIGPKKAKLLEKLHIYTLQDALEDYPRDYEDRTHITPIAEIREEGKYCIRAIVRSEPLTRATRSGMTLTSCKIADPTGTLSIVYFNHKYAAALLRCGQEYLFYGRVQFAGASGSTKTMNCPEFEKIGSQGYTGRIIPVYPLTAGLSQRDLQTVTEAALLAVPGDYPDPLPEVLRAKYNLPDSLDALEAIHRPKTLEDVAQARRRMIFEDLFLLCCGLQQVKEQRRTGQGALFDPSALARFYAVLPFQLTNAQRRAIQEVATDCASGRPMNRLIQGDVGSGKTMVAAALCLLAATNGYQSAFMAPTEILAAQHAETLAPLMAQLGVSVTLLTGSMNAAQKRIALEQIRTGEAQVVIGTHALIQEGVAFQHLGAVIADEQHRFGVAQRAALAAKGETPHILVMSATPIPRTLALILYGDLDVSLLDERPPGRKPVATYAVGEGMRRRITAFIEKQVQAGGQVYVVCPLVEESESGVELKSAEQHAADLRVLLPHRRIAVLHGRMKSADKEQIMQEFAAQKYDILVATTVIEVGVDVPNANLMVVEDADRFGLSQLHQLRGRVGRGSRESYCIFFGADKSQTTRDRLRILCQTNDGFEIAKADLEQRGPGDFFGHRQHGIPMLHVADLVTDLALMQAAREEAETLLAQDPQLTQYPDLQSRVQRMLAERNRASFN